MPSWETLPSSVRTALLATFASVVTVLGLLNGACGTTPPNGHCWRPGVCREVEFSTGCSSAESFAEGDCETTLQVGTCVSPSGDRRVHLYAPLHGFLAPDCDAFTGPGSHYDRR